MFGNKHRRTQSEHSGPFSFGPNPQGQKSPEARLSGRFVASSCQAEISNPLAVEDPAKLEQFSRERFYTMQMMHDQARRECEELKHEYQKKPTEMVHANLEAKVKVVRRLESQLSMYGGENDAPSGEKRVCRRGSSIEGSLPVSGGDGDVSTRPPPTPSYAPKHKGNDSGGAKISRMKQEVQLTRSHSDSSYKGIKKETDEDRMRFAASTGEIQKFTVARSEDFEIDSRRDNDSLGHSKSQDAASDESSDSAPNRVRPSSDGPPSMFCTADAFDSSKQLSHIIAIDDYELNGSDDENCNQFEDLGSPFNNFLVLKNRPAHLSIFLCYLISNSDASPVLFYLMSGPNYSTGLIKELRKWAYEIFSTFLVDKAPLKVKVDEPFVEAINDTLMNKFDKEDEMRSLFSRVRERFVLPQIRELLADYRSKRALGLGKMYGESKLRKGLDRNSELRVVDSVLWKDFEEAFADDCEHRQVFASVLATYFKQIGCTNARNGHLLERCPTFNAKDRARFSVFGKGAKRERALNNKGHNLLPQQYYVVTNCNFCQSVLFGVGSQGYQCQKCDQNFHKNCLEKIKDSCSGKKSKPPNMFDKLINKKPNSSALAVESRMERTTSMPSIRDVGKTTGLSYKPSFGGLNFWERARGHKDSSTKGTDKNDPSKSMDDAKSFASPMETIGSDVLPNEEHQNDAAEVRKSPPPSYTSSLVFNAPLYSLVPPDGPPSYSSLQISGDPELDVEQDLPPLDAIINKDHLKRLDKKEKKRQEVINELFYTEKTHLRDAKVMKLLFYLPMLQEPSLVELANLVFPRINEIVEFHSNLSSEFQQMRDVNSHMIVGDFAEILVTNFSGEKGESFKRACGQFCERQSQAQEQLKAQQRKEQKLLSLLQAAASNPYCRRLTLKDFLPIPMQRLTKYPLLIENLIKYTPVESEEYSRLQSALGHSREILLFVNKTVSEYQNRLKLTEIEKKLDARPIENSVDPVLKEYRNLDLSNFVLLHDGLLLWRIRRDRVIPIHVVLLDSILLLLQKQDDRLVLRCEHTLNTVAAKDDRRKLTHSPIIKLTNVLVRPVATDKCAFFLIINSNSTDSQSQIYDLIASNKEEKNRWCKHIDNAVETIARQKGVSFPVPHIPAHPTHYTTESESSQVIPDLDRKLEGLDAIDDEGEDDVESAEHRRTTVQNIEDDASGVPIVDSSVDSNSSVDPVEQLKQIDDVISHEMCERMKIWSQLCHGSDAGDDESELRLDPGVRNNLFKALLETDQMLCLINNQCSVSRSESETVHSSDLLEASQSVTGSAILSSADYRKALHDGDGITNAMEGFQPDSHVSFPISQILVLKNNIHARLMHLLESAIRTDEERQKLLTDLQLAQEKLADLELSNSRGQQAKYSLDKRLEPMSEMTEGKTDHHHPVASNSKRFVSALVIDETSNANRFDLKMTTDDDAEKKTDTTDFSIALASDFPDDASSTDV